MHVACLKSLNSILYLSWDTNCLADVVCWGKNTCFSMYRVMSDPRTSEQILYCKRQTLKGLETKMNVPFFLVLIMYLFLSCSRCEVQTGHRQPHCTPRPADSLIVPSTIPRKTQRSWNILRSIPRSGNCKSFQRTFQCQEITHQSKKHSTHICTAPNQLHNIRSLKQPGPILGWGVSQFVIAWRVVVPGFWVEKMVAPLEIQHKTLQFCGGRPRAILSKLWHTAGAVCHSLLSHIPLNLHCTWPTTWLNYVQGNNPRCW